MSIETYQFNLPITPGAIPPVLHLSQYDSGRTFTAVLRDDANVPFELDASATAVIKGRNAAGIAWQQDCTVSGANVTFTPSGAATDQFGVMPVTIEITESEEVISPLCVVFHIQKAGYTNEEAVLSPDFETAIQAAVAQALATVGILLAENQAEKNPSMTTPIGVDSSGKLWADTLMTLDAKDALINLLSHVAYTDTSGQQYLDELEQAWSAKLLYIVADYAQDRVILDTYTLDKIREGDDLIVTAYYDDGNHYDVDGYTLSGTLSVGTSEITVTYGDKTATINVNVKHNYANVLFTDWTKSGSGTYTITATSIAFKCANASQVTNWSAWVCDPKKTMWNAVDGKTLKCRIRANTDSLASGEYLVWGVGVYQSASITSLGSSYAKRKQFASIPRLSGGYQWFESDIECDIDDFVGALTPGSSATFGAWVFSQGLNLAYIDGIEIYEVDAP